MTQKGKDSIILAVFAILILALVIGFCTSKTVKANQSLPQLEEYEYYYPDDPIIFEIMFDISNVGDFIYDVGLKNYLIEYYDSDVFDYDQMAEACGLEEWPLKDHVELVTSPQIFEEIQDLQEAPQNIKDSIVHNKIYYIEEVWDEYHSYFAHYLKKRN